MKLNEFLVKAKIATYADEENAKKKTLEDGSTELIFEIDDYKYRDRYFGSNPFVGQEIVWKNNELIWCMNYFGRVNENLISKEKVYTFLKKCLKKVDKKAPFRGHSFFKEGNFEYFNEFSGYIADFNGSEKILFNKKQIYVLDYHGGSLNLNNI